MKTLSKAIFILLMLFVTSSVVASEEVAPLGFIIGKTSRQQVKKSQPYFVDIGVNKFTNGHMLQAPGKHFNVTGLTQVSLIFSKDDVLEAVVMELYKSQFNAVFGYLEKKYKVVKQQIPFVGNKSAELKQGDIRIFIDAPHLGFSMSVVYTSKSFADWYTSQHNQDKAKKEKQDASQF